MGQITAYLKSISPTPELYDVWQSVNDRIFNGSLKPIPLIIGLSGHGKHAGFCAPDHIALQPKTYASGDWGGVLLHEMCHQADHQEGIEYVSIGRVSNIHNSTAWCDRINGVMQQTGDKRFAAPYKRNRTGEMVATAEAPAGLTLIPFDQLKCWPNQS
ncbi:hypothetical protein ACLM45_13560 [Synechococcus sp. A10-1-5-9]|uniref:hypothetical protein n=1 Tax=Synechococcus sp. A10-1-5-9 TaxID=3392295 RepID=UPI0039E88F44